MLFMFQRRIILFHLHNNTTGYLQLLVPFYRWGNWVLEMLSNKWEMMLTYEAKQPNARARLFTTVLQSVIMNSAPSGNDGPASRGHPMVSGCLRTFSLLICSPCVRDFPAAPRQITNCGYSEVPCYFHWFLLNAACGSDSRMRKPI